MLTTLANGLKGCCCRVCASEREGASPPLLMYWGQPTKSHACSCITDNVPRSFIPSYLFAGLNTDLQRILPTCPPALTASSSPPTTQADTFRTYQTECTEIIKSQLWTSWAPKSVEIFNRLPPIFINGDSDAYYRSVATLQVRVRVTGCQYVKVTRMPTTAQWPRCRCVCV
jgi:hypothetical protein